LWYSLIRDDVEIFRDASALSYHDSNAILPYHAYHYLLRACNSAGCAVSPQVCWSSGELAHAMACKSHEQN